MPPKTARIVSDNGRILKYRDTTNPMFTYEVETRPSDNTIVRVSIFAGDKVEYRYTNYMSERANSKTNRNTLKWLYHITDESNMMSIIENACLSSWADMTVRSIHVPIPGGSALTRALDSRAGLNGFVHLYIREPDEAMLERLRTSGVMKAPVVLRISPDALNESAVFFIGKQRSELSTILGMDEIPAQATAHIRNIVPYRYIANIPDKYSCTVSSQHPSALIFIIDHSSSMSRSTEINGVRYDYMSEAVATIVNQEIGKLLEQCTGQDGSVSDKFEIAVIGYGSEAYSCWAGTLAGRGFATMNEIAAGKGNNEEFPWVEPREDGEGSHGEKALKKALGLLKEWMDSQASPYYYPPTVIHITDGNVSNNDRKEFLRYAEMIKKLKTVDGNVLLWNLNISPFHQSEFLLPTGAEISAFINTGLELYEASSVLPESFQKEIAAIKGDDDDIPHRAMGINVSLDSMSKLIDLSTKSLRK